MISPDDFIRFCCFHAAAQIQEVIEAGADVNVCFRHNDGTALMMAAQYNTSEVVELLLHAGADVNARDRSALGAFDYALENKNLKGSEVLARLRRTEPQDFFALCKHGAPQQVRDALDAGADTNARTGDGTTALMLAVRFNKNPEAISALLDAQANVNAKDKYGNTALMVGAERSGPEIVNLLLEAGANVNAKDNKSETALIKAAESGSNLAVVDLLLRAGADVNATRGVATPLIEAAECGAPEVVTRLIEAGADVNARNGWGATALMMATHTPEIVEILLQAGAEANLEDEDGYTVLMMRGLTPKAVKLLLQAGADVNAINDDGGTVLSWKDDPEIINLLCQAEEEADARDEALRRKTRAQSYKDLVALCESGTIQEVRDAIASGADINVCGEDKKTPLIAAVERNRLEIVEILLRAGANVNARGKYDDTALICAAANCNPDIVRALLKAGAIVNASDDCANTALMHAVRATEPVGDKEEVVRDLLQAGADPNARTTSLLWTPVMFAADMGAHQILNVLIDAGAEIDARDEVHRTALMLSDTPEVLNVLLDAGADPNAEDHWGKHTIDYAWENEKLKGTEALRRLEAASQ